MQNEQTMKELVSNLQGYQLELSEQVRSFEELHYKLAARLNFLITNNFSLLISILYRLDISEKKLKELLRQAKEVAAGEIIAHLIIERQLQKIESRKSFTAKPSNIPEDERW